MGRVRLIVSLAVAAVVSSGAVATAAGFHWHRDWTGVDKADVHATGKTCQASRLSDWRWHATARENHHGTPTPFGTTYTYDWIEPIRNDGKAHRLHYTHIGGTWLNKVPKSQRATVIKSTEQFLDKRTVTYVVQGGQDYLEYGFSAAPAQLVRWTWQHGGC